MDTKIIRELIQIVEQSSITTLELEESGSRIRISKSADRYTGDGTATPRYIGDISTEQITAQQVVPSDTAVCPIADIPGDCILSPMLGVYYAAPSPESEPFVKLGDKVKKGDVLCIIEAMKLMNEITAEKEGEITQVYAQSGQIVEFEQPIFRIK